MQKAGILFREIYSEYNFGFVKGISIILILCSGFVCGQQTQPDHKVTSKNGYVEYIPGDLPIILSVPHDGEKGPDFIPDRSGGDIHTKADAQTQKLGYAIRQAFYDMTGKVPYLVVNHMKRKKVDVNREVEEAAMGNAIAEAVWDDYHSFIDSAKEQVYNEFKKGLYLDIHAHDHKAQYVELGYLLDAEELALTDADLDDDMFIEKSSMRNMIFSHQKQIHFSELVRGNNSLGAMLDEAGYPAVPSPAHPSPGEDSYFRGGYSLNRHGSASGGTIDGIQVETNKKEIRDSDENVEKFAKAFVKVLIQYMEKYYDFHIAIAAQSKSN
jgi:hypothetical protein